MIQPKYTLEKIKFGIDPTTFEKAVVLYEKKKVTKFKENIRGYSGVVVGTQAYEVALKTQYYDYGHCNCYLGQTDVLCKHMIALAIHAILRGKPIPEEEKKTISGPVCSCHVGELSKIELSQIKKDISGALRYIKAYDGPSRTWFAYQNSLDEGVARLSATVSELPISTQTAQLIIDLLLKLDKKVCGAGVDDSNGIVGGFMQETVEVLKAYAKLDTSILTTFVQLKNTETCFGWEESLVALIK